MKAEKMARIWSKLLKSNHLATPELICPVCTLVCTLQVCYSCLFVCLSTPLLPSLILIRVCENVENLKPLIVEKFILQNK